MGERTGSRTTHINEIVEEKWYDESVLALPLWVGAGWIDPDLVCPQDELEQQEVEDLIAFRTSSL